MGKCFSSCTQNTGSAHHGKAKPGLSFAGEGAAVKDRITLPDTTTTSAPTAAAAAAAAAAAPVPKRDPIGAPPPSSHLPTDMEQRISNGSHSVSRCYPEKPRTQPARNGLDGAPRHSKSDFSESRAHRLFEKYKDSGEDAILADGMERFCQDLQVNPAEFIVLVLAWKFQASAMCRFTRTEFVNGCRALRADSIRGITAKFPELRGEVRAEAKFKDLYRFTFNFGLDVEGGQRSLPCEMAVPLWRLVFSQRRVSLLERWCNFLTDHQVRGISRDTWQMFLNFTEVIGDDLANYDDNEAWPSLFDDFVDYENEKEARKNLQDQRTETVDDGYDDGEGVMV